MTGLKFGRLFKRAINTVVKLLMPRMIERNLLKASSYRLLLPGEVTLLRDYVARIRDASRILDRFADNVETLLTEREEK